MATVCATRSFIKPLFCLASSLLKISDLTDLRVSARSLAAADFFISAILLLAFFLTTSNVLIDPLDIAAPVARKPGDMTPSLTAAVMFFGRF